MWNDNETTQDLLGFKVHADLICSLVTDPNLLPLTIGIFGDWGGGKTSIMKMVEAELDPESYAHPEKKKKCEKVACLYFNGWLFEGYDDAKSAILTSILLQLGEHKRFGQKVRDKVISLLKTVNWMRVVKFGLQEVALPAVSAYVTGGASLIPGFAGYFKNLVGWETASEKDADPSVPPSKEEEPANWEEFLKADKTPSGPMDVRTFRDRFSEMLQEAKIDSLVVLIDDLDRCSPERIIDNLEAIKLFLNVEHTAFVVGADPRIVRHAISTRYKTQEVREAEGVEAGEGLVTDYLEKLIQIPYHLPRLSPAEIETYMVLLFCLRDLSPENCEKCLTAFGHQRTTNRYSVFGYAAVREALKGIEIPAQLSQSLIFSTTAAPLITEGLKGNPRQVKRFLNAFILRKQLALTANLASILDEITVKLMVLEYGHPKEFRQLFEWQATQEGFPKELKALEEAILPPTGSLDNVEGAKKIDPQWATTFMLKWLAMEPRLADVDLRDYFWIARDRLQTTLTGISMVSPLVRRLFEDLISGSPRKRKAIGTIHQLAPDEMVSLFDLLELQILRHPDQKIGYDAVRELIEGDIPGAPQLLARTLTECPPDSIPPAVGVDLLMLQKGKPQLEEAFKPCIEVLASSDTKVGRAIKKSQT